MLLSVARSGTDRPDRPSPQNSTNLSTTPCLRSISVSVRTRSVAVEPAGSAPRKRTPTTMGGARYAGWPRIAASASIPPVPQPSTPRPLTIVVWESVPIRVSGIATSGVLAGAWEGGPHRRRFPHRGDTGEVLHEDARGQER